MTKRPSNVTPDFARGYSAGFTAAATAGPTVWDGEQHGILRMPEVAPRAEADRTGGGIGVMTLVQAAERLGVQPGTLRVQIAKGKLKAKKLGRDWLVTEREIERYAKENRR